MKCKNGFLTCKNLKNVSLNVKISLASMPARTSGILMIYNKQILTHSPRSLMKNSGPIYARDRWSIKIHHPFNNKHNRNHLNKLHKCPRNRNCFCHIYYILLNALKIWLNTIQVLQSLFSFFLHGIYTLRQIICQDKLHMQWTTQISSSWWMICLFAKI